MSSPRSVSPKTQPPTGSEHGNDSDKSAKAGADEHNAAKLIQRNYRGYRERRQLRGMGLDASARWTEAIKEARWRNTTRPRPRSTRAPSSASSTPEERSRAASDAARQNWKRIGQIARRAGADDPEDTTESEEDMNSDERREHRRKKAREKSERERTAKIMDLQYFLEMVDQKHRYGSNLRAYHEHWKKSNVDENFFYWLDHGAGKNFEHPTVSRERLEKEQVRYLSREERMKYLVQIDGEGRLCWAKNGERITTSVDYKDSVDGVVPKDDPTPVFGPGGKIEGGSRRSSSSSSSSGSERSGEGGHYVNNDLEKHKGLTKLKYVSAATILNHLLRGSVKPNSWIFVADTSFRLYIGIKQSGAFQHSSFLRGARISAAGLIKIKNGQLRRLSPLSGHYRPPTKNFRAFVHSLQEQGVDMSRVSISRSYAVLVGLEAYVKTRRKVKHGVQHVADAETRVVHPDVYRRRKEEEKDKSRSAQREREVLSSRERQEEVERRERSWRRRVWRKMRGMSLSEEKSAEEKAAEHRRKKILSRNGQDAESGIAPEGRRDGVGDTRAVPGTSS